MVNIMFIGLLSNPQKPMGPRLWDFESKPGYVYPNHPPLCMVHGSILALSMACFSRSSHHPSRKHNANSMPVGMLLFTNWDCGELRSITAIVPSWKEDSFEGFLQARRHCEPNRKPWIPQLKPMRLKVFGSSLNRIYGSRRVHEWQQCVTL